MMGKAIAKSVYGMEIEAGDFVVRRDGVPNYGEVQDDGQIRWIGIESERATRTLFGDGKGLDIYAGPQASLQACEAFVALKWAVDTKRAELRQQRDRLTAKLAQVNEQLLALGDDAGVQA
jgi:hypothetical protein